MIDRISLIQKLSDSNKFVLQSEYDNAKKNKTVAFLLAIFLGGIGGHHFYLGKVFLGVLYLLLVWTGIPSFIALVELIFLSGRVDDYNDNKFLEIYHQLEDDK